MILTLLNGLGIFAVTAASYDTIPLNGFTTWTQTELDKSSGNNGYANGCCTKLTVIKDAAYIVGDGNQAIKAVYGNSGSAYNNCIVNWTYGTGGPCTAGNVWAPTSGTVNYADYEGVRIAVLNANGQPANFTKITLRVTNGANYSSKMRYWEGAPVRDADGYFYFDFASFVNVYLTLEYTKNLDSNSFSTRYFIKDNKIYAGPVWDFDLSSGNVSDRVDEEGYRIYLNIQGRGDNSYDSTRGLWNREGWFKALFEYEEFSEMVTAAPVN